MHWIVHNFGWHVLLKELSWRTYVAKIVGCDTAAKIRNHCTRKLTILTVGLPHQNSCEKKYTGFPIERWSK